MHLVDIAVFPVKSAEGIAVASAEVEPRGLAGDRRWMLVDMSNRFVSQRELPALARLGAEPVSDPQGGLRLSFEEQSIDVARPPVDSPREPVRIWQDTLALPEAPAAAPWLSRVFGQPLRLFYQADDAHRPVEEWATEGDEVSLSDGFPILIATNASLDALREAAGGGFGMERFRPNLVIDGASAWAEDGWAQIQVGAIIIDLVKPCGRCAITTIDQERGVVSGGEPLDTLRRIRMSGDRRVPGFLFGWNAVPRSLGRLSVGDRVEVLETRTPWPILPERSAQLQR